eukprot:scaffold7704_cov112-Isochrysis_galbana.AAC.16
MTIGALLFGHGPPLACGDAARIHPIPPHSSSGLCGHVSAFASRHMAPRRDARRLRSSCQHDCRASPHHIDPECWPESFCPAQSSAGCLLLEWGQWALLQDWRLLAYAGCRKCPRQGPLGSRPVLLHRSNPTARADNRMVICSTFVIVRAGSAGAHTRRSCRGICHQTIVPIHALPASIEHTTKRSIGSWCALVSRLVQQANKLLRQALQKELLVPLPGPPSSGADRVSRSGRADASRARGRVLGTAQMCRRVVGRALAPRLPALCVGWVGSLTLVFHRASYK